MYSKYIILLFVFVISYLAGNISPATIIGKAKGVDIRKEGSGNPGTTNTLRVLGKEAALIVLLVDILKGTVMVLLWGHIFGESAAMIAAFGAFLGHVFPIAMKFKGGKGVATAFGVLVALHPGLGLGCLGVVLLAVIVTRRVSPGSIAGAIAAPLLSWWLLPAFVPYCIIMAAIVIIRHRSNIVRMMNGEEPKISFKKKEKTE